MLGIVKNTDVFTYLNFIKVSCAKFRLISYVDNRGLQRIYIEINIDSDFPVCVIKD